MSIGFRKSLFGFNSSDVIEYIEKAHRNFSKKEEALKKEMKELENTLSKTRNDMDKLTAERDELNVKLTEFNAKSEEIERLSENIGKLYLVAQTNAKAIIENSEANAELSKQEVTNNLTSIDDAHEALKALRESIIKTSDDFTNEVDRLIKSLDTTREQIAQNEENIDAATNEFKTVFSEINK